MTTCKDAIVTQEIEVGKLLLRAASQDALDRPIAQRQFRIKHRVDGFERALEFHGKLRGWFFLTAGTVSTKLDCDGS